MPISKKILKFLEKNKAKYELIEHRTVFTAFDKAQTLRVSEKIIGKTLAVKFNGDYGLVLIGADKILDKGKFKKVVNIWRKKIGKKPAKEIGFVSETWMKKRLIGVKVGAVPPFGNLWKLSTFIDKSLLKNRQIIINGGDYNTSIKINSASLKTLVLDLIIDSFAKSKK